MQCVMFLDLIKSGSLMGIRAFVVVACSLQGVG